MDRAGLVVLMVLTVMLLRIGDSHRDTTGESKEGADQAVWDQLRSRVRSGGYWPGGPGDAPRPSGKASPPTSKSRTLVRLARSASTQGDGRHISKAGPAHGAGASREDIGSAPREGALRTARQSQHRSRVNHRQSSKPSTRRLTG